MAAESTRQVEYCELARAFPLVPIRDEPTYRAAIGILDRLFERDDRRTPAEVAYFHALAELAFDYESRPAFAACATARPRPRKSYNNSLN